MSSILLSAGLSLHGLVLAATTKPKTTNYSTFIFLAFILLIGYFLLIRPQRQRARRQQQQQQEIGVGEEVMLTSGIIGTVMEIEGDRAYVEIADGVEIQVVRRAIAQRVSAPEPVVDAPAEETQDVGPDPAGLESGDYDHASDESWDDAKNEGDAASGDGSHTDGGSSPATGDSAPMGGTGDTMGSGGTPAGAEQKPAADDVPRVPGGGLGDSMQPDGPAGKE